MNKKIRVGIIGAAGFVGYELINILTKHDSVDLVMLNSSTMAGKTVASLYSDFANEKLKFTDYSITETNKLDLDVVFLAVPHGVAASLAPQIKTKIIDLSAGHRLSAVYGLPELFKIEISGAQLVANPGCYATACLLSVFPIKKLVKYVVFDCKSGWSGAGRDSVYVKNKEYIQDNIVAYKLTRHQHCKELQKFFGHNFSFTPHVFDAFRGIMCTAHILLKETASSENLKQMYNNFYAGQPFVKITSHTPSVTEAQNTNFCLIGGFEIDDNNQMVVISVIDNLLKGASGQAVQNMNIMFGLPEDHSLK